jgi:hypothetical protein
MLRATHSGMDEMDSLKSWWKGMFSKNRDRRRAGRMRAPKLVAYYWTGGKPEKHEVRDISPTGIYVVTDERWYLGTIVKMTLQIIDDVEGYSTKHIAVESKAVRWGEDGVGMTFVLMDSSDNAANLGPLPEADRKSLAIFLSRFWKEPE